MDESGHLREELQELLDGRLDAERESAVRSHLDRCPQCRREMEAIRWVKRVLKEAGEVSVPPSLEESIREGLEAEERSPWRSRRTFLAAAACLLLALGAGLWLYRRFRDGLPAAVADDYRRFQSGALPLEIHAASPERVEVFFRERGIKFRTRVFDLAMMNYRVQGGRLHQIDGQPSALFVYRGGGDKVLVCQMYRGRLEQLPVADEVRTHRGFRFQIYRRDAVTVVFWQEGDVVCVLTGDFGSEEIVALAFEKAML